MITIKKLVNCIYRVLAITVLITLIGLQQKYRTYAQTDLVKKRCGIDQSVTPQGLFWGIKSTNDAKIPLESIISTIPSKFINEISNTAFDFQVSSDGTAMAYFTGSNFNDLDRTNDINSVKVLRTDGAVLELAHNPGWLILGPELSPGHFGMLAYDEQLNTVILDLEYSFDKLVISKVETLALQLDLSGGLYYRKVDISPGWKYVAFIDVFQSGLIPQYSIYSRDVGRVIWRTPLNGGTYPHVFWDNRKDSNVIAWVNMGGFDGDGSLIGISSDGEVEVKHNLSDSLSEDIRTPGGTTQVNTDGYLALWLQTNTPDQLLDKGLFLLAVNSGEIIDLCISDKTITGRFYWAENGKYLLAQRFDGVNAVPLEMMIIDVETGNYSLQYLAHDGQALYLVGYSKPQEQPQ